MIAHERNFVQSSPSFNLAASCALAQACHYLQLLTDSGAVQLLLSTSAICELFIVLSWPYTVLCHEGGPSSHGLEKATQRCTAGQEHAYG